MSGRKYLNAYRSWTDAEMAKVLYFKEKGMTDSFIAKILARSTNAIRKRYEVMNCRFSNSKLDKIHILVNDLNEEKLVEHSKSSPTTLYAVGSITPTGICLQKKIHSKKEVLNKSIYLNSKQVFYKLVEVTVDKRIVEK